MSNKTLASSPREQTILVTGGAGFIGSHTAVELLEAGYNVIILDDLSNSNIKAVSRVAQICGLEKQPDRLLGLSQNGVGQTQVDVEEFADASGKTLVFVEGSILDRPLLEAIFSHFPINAIIHFAGFKAVGESVQKPWEYYWNNISGTLVLVDVAREHGVKNLIFSSSATVYGDAETVPMTEDSPKNAPTNPYGWTKSMLEQIMSDLYVGDNEWNIALLRYFNPIGAHESGLIGEDPLGIPNNLLPYVAQVAIGKLDHVGVFGNDYDTPDGTGVRDYIHVVDLARGHVAALEWLGGKVGSDVRGMNCLRDAQDAEGAEGALDWGSIAGRSAADGTRRGVGIFNLGTGHGSSVLDVIHAFEKACGHEIPYEIKPRREGDIATSYAACDKAARELNWVAQYDLDRMCEDGWRWQSQNPNGYAD